MSSARNLLMSTRRT